MVPLQAQDVTKYQAGHGKHTEGRKLVAIKRTPQNGLFSVSVSVPDFGRPWTPHRWHQVKVNGTPKNWYDASNGLCGRLMASELSAHCFETFFPSWNWKLRKKYFCGETLRNGNVFSGKHIWYQDETYCWSPGRDCWTFSRLAPEKK